MNSAAMMTRTRYGNLIVLLLTVYCCFDFSNLGHELLEELLIYDDLLLEYFNDFLALPVS